MPRFFELIAQVFPEFTEAPQGLWETSLDNIGMLFHPAPTLLNLGRMESQKPFDYYIDGFTPTVAALVEKLDAERLKVAEALGIKLPTVVEWVRNTYGVKGSNLYEALQNNEAYRGISAPVLADANAKKELRYVIEDVPSGLVPVSELGRKFGVATPAIDMVISLADTIFEADFRSSGRNLEQVGLADMDPDEIIKLQ
jgi:opine dehydrogenase